MNGFIFVIDIMREVAERKNFKECGIRFIDCVIFIIVLMYIYGGFGICNPSVPGSLGRASLNLNALINPMDVSSIVKSLPYAFNGQKSEGACYLGLGVIFMSIASLLYIEKGDFRRFIRKSNIPLSIMFFVIVILSLSPVVTLGDRVLIDYTGELPKPIISVWSVVRATGRLIWPFWYLFTIKLLKFISERAQNRNIIAVFLLCSVIQGIEILPYKIYDKNIYPGYTNEIIEFFQDNSEVEKLIDHIVFFSDGYGPKGYEKVSIYASTHGKTLNTGYFGRFDLFKKSKEKRKTYIDEVSKNELQADTIYCVYYEFYESNDEIRKVENYSDIEIIRLNEYYLFWRNER